MPPSANTLPSARTRLWPSLDSIVLGPQAGPLIVRIEAVRTAGKDNFFLKNRANRPHFWQLHSGQLESVPPRAVACAKVLGSGFSVDSVPATDEIYLIQEKATYTFNVIQVDTSNRFRVLALVEYFSTQIKLSTLTGARMTTYILPLTTEGAGSRGRFNNAFDLKCEPSTSSKARIILVFLSSANEHKVEHFLTDVSGCINKVIFFQIKVMSKNRVILFYYFLNRIS